MSLLYDDLWNDLLNEYLGLRGVCCFAGELWGDSGTCGKENDEDVLLSFSLTISSCWLKMSFLWSLFKFEKGFLGGETLGVVEFNLCLNDLGIWLIGDLNGVLILLLLSLETSFSTGAELDLTNGDVLFVTDVGDEFNEDDFDFFKFDCEFDCDNGLEGVGVGEGLCEGGKDKALNEVW